MKVSGQGDESRKVVKRSDTFTGAVWSESLAGDPPDKMVNNVLFTPGARTYWHRHEHGQILHITHGQGKVRSRGGEEVIVRPGDTIWTDPNEEHYHGADTDRYMSHVSITFGSTDWLEPVADEDYGTEPTE